MKVNWINSKEFKILPTDEYDKVQQFSNYAYPERLIILETKKSGYIEPRETHINKETAEVISVEKRERSLLSGELDLDTDYFMKYRRVIRKNGCENEIQEIINKATNEVEQKLESHLANRGIQSDDKRKKSFEQFMLIKKSKMKHEVFMNRKYKNWTSEEKVEYWYGKLLLQDRMQTQVTEGIGNIGLYIMNRKTKEKLLRYEKNWEDFLEKYCSKFRIPIHIGNRLFELYGNEGEWKSLAKKVGYIEEYWNKK
jgi:hypothetical protein